MRECRAGIVKFLRVKGNIRRIASCGDTETYRQYAGSQRMPKKRPSLDCLPVRDKGTPVFFEILRFKAVTPTARFHEKVIPGPSFMVSTVRIFISGHGYT